MTTAFVRCFQYAFIVLANCLFFVMVFSSLSPAAQLTLAWNVNPDPSVAGYKLYYGTASRTYDMSVDVGLVTRYTLTGIDEGKPSYFAVTAYDTNRSESAYSKELECFSLVPSAGVNGSISPASAVVVSRGMSQTFRIFPAVQYAVSDVLVDAASVGPVEAYTFSNVDRNHRISASFVPVHFQSGSLSSFNNDVNPDILWRNNSTGEIYVLYMDGVSCTGGAFLITVADPRWTIVGTDDFNRDRNPDILWRNVSTGENFVLYMDGVSYIGGDFLPLVTDPSWTIAGTGEFNSDGNPDILWRNTSTGENIVWYMNGHTVSGWGYPSAVPDPSWTIVGTGDFNSDGKTDILWRNASTGENYVWYLDGVTYTGGAPLPTVADPSWTIVGTGDFNSDGKTDTLWRNLSTGENYVCFMDGVAFTGWAFLLSITDPNWVIVEQQVNKIKSIASSFLAKR